MELQRDLVGIDNLVQPGREFIREGCLQKLSRKGYQQRMFFLVRYASIFLLYPNFFGKILNLLKRTTCLKYFL